MTEGLSYTNFGLNLYYLSTHKKFSKMFIHSIHKKDLHMPKESFKVSVGFTLIEVTVVMAIVGILASISILSFGTQNTKRVLETNAREFSAVLMEAQNYALAGKQVSGGVVRQFDVVGISSTSYKIQATFKNGSSSTLATYSLKQGVIFTSSGWSVSFSLPWATTSPASIVLNKEGSSHTVCLNASGKIIDQVGNGSCP